MTSHISIWLHVLCSLCHNSLLTIDKSFSFYFSPISFFLFVSAFVSCFRNLSLPHVVKFSCGIFYILCCVKTFHFFLIYFPPYIICDGKWESSWVFFFFRMGINWFSMTSWKDSVVCTNLHCLFCHILSVHICKSQFTDCFIGLCVYPCVNITLPHWQELYSRCRYQVAPSPAMFFKDILAHLGNFHFHIHFRSLPDEILMGSALSPYINLSENWHFQI